MKKKPPTVEAQRRALERIGRELLVVLGEDPEREGLRNTPSRWARAWQELLAPPGTHAVTFESVATDQLVIVRGIDVWSLCEHHLLPFRCRLAIGYVCGKKVLGLSKFARIAHGVARGLQIQERLVHQVADAVSSAVEAPDVAVLGVGEHLCMTMRGARTPAEMVTSVVRGVFRKDAAVRAEFLGLAR